MATRFYLGKEVDAAGGAPGEKVELDARDLLTHGLIVGMTGSGKTGLAIALMEEALRAGVPVLAVDPKGDLGNLLLL
ncbi:MAG TPA: helicase HerA-like domain-containing protein, partial [Vicinamibacteria bacterium]|nr:helicase HerA-like domain-containing protein [Vicinamibacteria bacterium]